MSKEIYAVLIVLLAGQSTMMLVHRLAVVASGDHGLGCAIGFASALLCADRIGQCIRGLE